MIVSLTGLLLGLLVVLPGRHPDAVCRLDDLVLWLRGR